MSNPFKATSTCDVYWDNHAAPPDVQNVPCTLVAAWEEGQAHGTRATPTLMYTHILHLEPDVDVRDHYAGAMTTAAPVPLLQVPGNQDPNPTTFLISFVERVNKGQRADHKVVYLNRLAPNWPSNSV